MDRLKKVLQSSSLFSSFFFCAEVGMEKLMETAVVFGAV